MIIVTLTLLTLLCFRQTPQEITEEDLAVAVPGECLFPELSAENEDASHEEEKGILVYTDSHEGQALKTLPFCPYINFIFFIVNSD